MTDETPTRPRRTRKAPATKPAGPDASFEAAEAAAVHEASVEAAVAVLEANAPPGGDTAPDLPAPAVDVVAPAPPEPAAAPALRLERTGLDAATAERVEVHMGGIGSLEADEVFVQWGGVGAARAERVGVEFGSVGAALAGEVTVSQGFAGSVVAREATIEQGFARTVIAQRVRFSRPSAVLLLIAARVEGEVRPLLDWRGALAAGAALGLVGLLAGWLRPRR